MIKNITMVLCSNMINMLVSVAIGFILPKYLTLESYGYYKLFQFILNQNIVFDYLFISSHKPV